MCKILYRWDSNLRKLAPADLQSASFAARIQVSVKNPLRFLPKIPKNFSGLPPRCVMHLVGRVGFEPTMFTLWDRFYRPVQNHHPCSLPIILLVTAVGLEPTEAR